MYETQPHEMRLKTTHPSGAEEWYCPACGRRFVMQWPPKYKRIIPNGGDELAAHNGGKGGLKTGTAQIRPSKENAPPVEEDLSLEPWKEWLNSEEAIGWWPDE